MKELIEKYGLYWNPDVYRFYGYYGFHKIIYLRTDPKRVVFRMLDDEYDDNELWISVSPQFIRLKPRNQEDYEDKEVLKECLQDVSQSKNPRFILRYLCNYVRHKNFYDDMKNWWHGPANVVKTYQSNERKDIWWIHYDFQMKDCKTKHIHDFFLATCEHAKSLQLLKIKQT